MPEWIGTFKSRISIAAFFESGHGTVAGLLEWSNEGEAHLHDTSATLELAPEWVADLASDIRYWAAFHFGRDGTRRLYCRPIAARGETERHLRYRERYLRRWRIHQEIRRWFLNAGFLETDTPVRVPCPGMEPYLDTFAAGDRFLRTSPELHMKRLLAAGFDPIFQIAPCFRAGDKGTQHREEFLMLEWYRLFADLGHLVDDLGSLLTHLAPLSTDPEYFRRPPKIVRSVSLFREYLGLNLTDHTDPAPLRACLEHKGMSWDPEDDWDTLYFLLFLNFIEPKLGLDAPTIVTDYPASQAALAKKAPQRPGELPTCYRFELYVHGGIELANAFYELTDADEQRARFEADRAHRAALDKVVYACDEDFLAALAGGLPPAAGIALGVDRLTAALLGERALAPILPFG
ncbi:EF-P lysine aminoacylase EpmA [Sulfidibacter corallicola]|uniref:EF-P lysine aminoacylase GenX n=1 Tax=Sulfidibacter corallicola TaxID=2818388 RepID=A0A8A4TS94_SULCO|nr:EF-P lysine aminoacylase EpmA [Sulfidibacter corallicola]QTD51932.1 EF-P lysine aminoacylase GenX [Sulfidibacter corallicola]